MDGGEQTHSTRR